MSGAARPLAVVTGAAKRVGAACAVELARHGFDLLLTYRASRSEMEQTCAEARAVGLEQGAAIAIESMPVDLADPTQVAAFCARLAALPRLDALVHNASSYAPSPLGRISDAEAIGHFRVNALAPLLLTQAAAAALRRSILPHGGAVVCFGDIHVLGRPRRNLACYGMSKAALTHLVEALARELAPLVRVNAIAPGVVAWPEDTPAAERAAYEARIPLARSGTPEDAANAVRWLVLEAAYVTGEVIRVDGGRWLT